MNIFYLCYSVCISVYLCPFMCLNVHVHAYTCACLLACVCMCVCVCVCVGVFVCVCVGVCTLAEKQVGISAVLLHSTCGMKSSDQGESLWGRAALCLCVCVFGVCVCGCVCVCVCVCVFPPFSLSDRREALFNFGFSQGWRCIYSFIQRGKHTFLFLKPH